MAKKTIRRRINRPLTREERERHAAIREQVAKELPQLQARARAAFAKHDELARVMQVLKATREREGLSLAEVSLRSGIDKARLSRLENRVDANPTLDTLLRIADALGVKLRIGVAA